MPPATAHPNLDRLPPHSPESEAGILGCVLCAADPKTVLAECMEAIGDGQGCFYDQRHLVIYRAMLSLYDAGAGIDLRALASRLQGSRMLEQVGGLPYITGLPDLVPSAANLPYFLETVCHKRDARKLIAACQNTLAHVYEFTGDNPRPLIEAHEATVLSLLTQKTENTQRPIKEVVGDALERIESRFEAKGTAGLGTGFMDLDRLTCGLLHEGEFIIIAARPSVGKTSLAMNIAEHVGLDLGLPVGVFSLEMNAVSLVTRVLCSRGRVNAQSVRDGKLIESDFPKLAAAAGALSKSKIYIEESPGISVLQLKAKARRMHQLYGIKLFVIDYLQLLNGGKQFKSRQEEITYISQQIKVSICRELNVPCIVLCQLNRDMENGPKGKPRRPRMADLRESGSLEQDADVVGLLWRATDEREEDSYPVELVIDKQRNGPTGVVPLTFIKAYTRFETAAKINQEDLPI